jgi:hypothetical protein
MTFWAATRSERGLRARGDSGRDTVTDPTIKQCDTRAAEEQEMAKIGDRIAVASKVQPRTGVVTAVSGAMITVRWDTGDESSLIPGPGVLSVVTDRQRTPSVRARQAATTRASTPAKKTSAAGPPSAKGTKQVSKRAATGKKAVPKGSSSGGKTAKKKR